MSLSSGRCGKGSTEIRERLRNTGRNNKMEENRMLVVGFFIVVMLLIAFALFAAG